MASCTEVCVLFHDFTPNSQLTYKIFQFLRKSTQGQLSEILQPRVLCVAAVGEIPLACHFFQIPLLLLSELKFCLVR